METVFNRNFTRSNYVNYFNSHYVYFLLLFYLFNLYYTPLKTEVQITTCGYKYYGLIRLEKYIIINYLASAKRLLGEALNSPYLC